MRTIELYGTKVVPLVREMLADTAPGSAGMTTTAHFSPGSHP